MYYNSNQNNNDYYNSYKKEMSELAAYRKEENTQKLTKLVLFFFALALFIIATLYLYKYLNPTHNLKNSFLKSEQNIFQTEPLGSIVIREEELPMSIQLRDSKIQIAQNIKSNATDTSQHQKTTSSINEKDIALIVQIIMSQMNTKVEKPLEEQLQEVNNKIFINKNLKKTNHYNKIVLTQNELIEVKNASLMELSTSLANITNEKTNFTSHYTQELTKEVLSRENEMRIIIVQKGDTLSKIAKKAYGDNRNYQKILSANPEIIKNPNQIFVGQRLRIPS